MTAFIAKELASRQIKIINPDEIFIAGLLHDIGEAAMYHADPKHYEELYEERLASGLSISFLEEDILGMNHKEIGARVLESWNFPDIYVDAAREHGMVNITSPHRLSVVTVSIADILSDEISGIPLSDDKRKNMTTFRAYAGVSETALSGYNAEYCASMQKDKLFQECKALFHFDGNGDPHERF